VNQPSSVKSARKFQRGTTLVETLVALLVLSIGLLGVAALQVNALTTNSSAHMRSQASVLAYDLADRMRANRTAALKTDATGYQVVYGAPPSGTTLNALDLQNWKAALANTLPSGDGEMQLVGNIAVIRVRWTDKTTGLNQVFETRTQL
jgi:type IV pilus assembly protein PilV